MRYEVYRIKADQHNKTLASASIYPCPLSPTTSMADRSAGEGEPLRVRLQPLMRNEMILGVLLEFSPPSDIGGMYWSAIHTR